MRKTKAIIKALWEDVTYNRVIFESLLVLISVSNLVVFLTEASISGFRQSVLNVRYQLGADIVVVSEEYDSNLKSALFSGTPSTFSFPRELYEGIEKIDGIDQCSSSLFVSSLDSSCCEEQVEFVIYDDQTDFILKSFIDQYESKNNKRDIIIGSDINYQLGENVTFFGCIFHVAAKLKPTGMGYDQCIFVNQECGESISTFLKMESFYNKSSLVLIKKKTGTNIDDLCDAINKELRNKGLVAYKTSNIYTDVENDIHSIARVSICYIIFLMILVCVALFVITFMNVETKGKYTIIMYILGVKKTKIRNILVVENLIISVLSAFIGNIIGIIILIMFKTYISETLNLSVYIGIGDFKFLGLNMIGSALLLSITVLVAYKLALPDKEQYKKELV